jgi:hypothetical protein
MGGMEWSALDHVCEILGITDPELLVIQLATIRDRQNAKASIGK